MPLLNRLKSATPKSKKKAPVKHRTRKVSHKGARAKGRGFENEIVTIGKELGVPVQRVIMSGAHWGAKSDLKLGVQLLDNGEYPAHDEGLCEARAECKNHAANGKNVEKVYSWLGNIRAMIAPTDAPSAPFKDLKQDDVATVLFWRRKRLEAGVLENKQYNEVALAIMGVADYFKLLKQVVDLKKENADLKATVRTLKK